MALLEIINVENFRKVLRNIRRVGLVTTARYIVSDLLFDMKYKIDTINTEQLDNLSIDSPNKKDGIYYEGTNAYIFQKMISLVKLEPSQSVFVDFGSGKGKALFMAAERGFRKVIGVEFSIELVEICRRNLEVFKAKSRSKTEFEILHMDASEYEIPADANLMFFSNPFNEAVTEKVIGNILRSYDQTPREVWVVHLHPQGNMAFVRHPRFEVRHEAPEGYILRLKPAN
ncbi:MAG: class I SAM-dependent methyltransferase [Chloroflexota bacterium]|nr:class I SAM-dependent methyltransferase [Chloroflexota bacterium]MBI5704656.1 class I SAM-dependent methyltransferase [Chloroflexota bacterium]